MPIDDDILTAIEAMYEASVDATRWQKAMEQIASITDSRAATFCVIDGSDQPRLPVLSCLNFESRFMDSYLESMVPHDPTVQYIVAHPDQKIVHDSEFISEREKDRHFYYDWHHSFSDTRHRLAGMVNPSPKVQSGITLHRTRSQGDFRQPHIERFRYLHRHLDRAVRIAFQLGTLGAVQQISCELLDRSPLAIFVLDEKGRVVFTNHAAQGLIAADEGVNLTSEGVWLTVPAENRKLQDLIARASMESGPDRVAGAMQALRRSGKRPYSIHVSPLPRMSPALSMVRPAACVIVTDPESEAPLSEDVLRALYRLTRSEARLAVRLAAGDDLHKAANTLAIGYATARTQLSAIFRKTETRRQGELVRVLLTSLAPQSP